MNADDVRNLEGKLFKAITTYLRGLDEPAHLFARSFFMSLTYFDKVSNVMTMGQAHIKFDGGTGIGKTAMVQSAALALDAKVSRIQGNPDLMPHHILGDYIFVENAKGDRSIRLRPGKIYSHIVFIDESNRIRPQSKSAILEAMEERSVTPMSEHMDFGDDKDSVVAELPLFPVSGNHRDFTGPRFNMFLMTQNPFGDEQGTYPTPRAELDRTTISIPIHRPTFKEEQSIRSRNMVGKKIDKVANLNEILEAARFVYDHVKISPTADEYITALIRNTDPKSVEGSPAFVQYIKDHIMMGDNDGIGSASPRVEYHLEAASVNETFFSGSDMVRPEHVKDIAANVIAHRLVLKPEKHKVKSFQVFQEVLENTKVPKHVIR